MKSKLPTDGPAAYPMPITAAIMPCFMKNIKRDTKKCEHTFTVPMRDGKSCGRRAKVVVLHIAQPTPSTSLNKIPNMKNISVEGMSIKNLCQRRMHVQ